MKLHQTFIRSIIVVVTLVLFPLILAFLAYQHVAPLFQGEFTQHLGSIEVSYIQMAKFIEQGKGNPARQLLLQQATAGGWQPLWYLGYPISLLYTPFVPYFEFLSHIFLQWSYSHAYRFLTAASYVGGLVTLYFFARLLFKNSVAGFVTALWYGLMPSVIAWLYPEVAADRFGVAFIDPRRFTILVRWGEGPHIVSLVFLPLAGLFWVKYLREGNRSALLLGGVCSALVAFTNTVGLWGLLILVFSFVVGALGQKNSEWGTVVKRTLGLGLLAYGLAAFWFNPLFFRTFFHEGGGLVSYVRDAFPWGWLIGFGILSIYIIVSKKILHKVPGLPEALCFFSVMFWLVNTYYASGLDHIELVPQVLRLTTEVDLGFSLVVGGIVAAVGLFIAKKTPHTIFQGAMVVVTGAVLVLAISRQIPLTKELPAMTIPAEIRGVDLTKTGQYEIAKILEGKITGGERVFVPGNYSFFLNYFSDIPQLRGALFQSSIHPWPDHIYYQMVNGKDADISLAWLKIANIGWLVYSGGRDIYRDFKVPYEKFDTSLELVEEHSGDRIYRVPLKDTSLAKAVPAELLKIPKPFNAIDQEPIFSYVEALESSQNHLTMTELRNGVYEIKGTTGSNEIILAQIAYAPGWKASDSGGRKLEIKQDHFGFITIKPNQNGPQNIKLYYTTPLEVGSGRLVTIITLCFILFIFVRPFGFAQGKSKPPLTPNA